MKATVKDFNGNDVEVKVGDWVGFKCDIEQSGQIIEIKTRNNWYGDRSIVFVLENKEGFRGEYIRGAKQTEEDAERCWV